MEPFAGLNLAIQTLGGGLVYLPTSKHLVQFGMTLIVLLGAQKFIYKKV